MQRYLRLCKNRNLTMFIIAFASLALILMVVLTAVKHNLTIPIEQTIYVALPLIVIIIGCFFIVNTEGYRESGSIFVKYFLVPFLLSSIFLFAIYMSTGSVRGAFSRSPAEITTKDPFSACNTILWRFLWDMGYSGLAALIVASVTPYFSFLFVKIYNKFYVPALKILGGRVKPNVHVTQKSFRLIEKVKTFMLINSILSAGIILFLPKVTTKIYLELATPYGTVLSPDPIIFLSFAPLLSSVLVEIRNISHRIYWSFLKLLIGFLSISNVISFIHSPLFQIDYLNLLEIIPGLYIYNILGVSFFTTILKEEFLKKLSKTKRAFLAFSLVLGFVIFVTFGFCLRELTWNVFKGFVAFIINGLLDALAISVTTYASCLTIQKITHRNYHPRVLSLQSFVWVMVIWVIYSMNPNIVFAKIHPGILLINILSGFLFPYLPCLSFFITGVSFVITTILFGSFGWGQVIITIGALMISISVKDSHKYCKINCGKI